MLQWMRRMIRLRRLFKVFGRGTMEFLRCPNRKILASTRRSAQDTILCVANMSRHAQPAQLDLSAFLVLTPVEMIGFTPFPKVTSEPYLLTLSGYGFLWFELRSEM